MSKSRHTAEWKIEIVKKYLSGDGSYDRLADVPGVIFLTIFEPCGIMSIGTILTKEL